MCSRGVYLLNIALSQLMCLPGCFRVGSRGGKTLCTQSAGQQSGQRKENTKVCVKCASESQRERKKIACVILKKLLSGQFLLAVPAASPLESHKASLGSSCHIFRLRKKPPSDKFLLLLKKENKRKSRVLVSKEPGLVFE